MLNSRKYTQSTYCYCTAIANDTDVATAMSLLQAVEQYLCYIDTCPSSIIYRLFAETTSPPIIEDLVAFFAGNGVPQTLSFRLYRACNAPAASELVRQLFYTRFSLWHTSDTVRRHTHYYDVRMKKLVRLNVPYLPDFLDDRKNPVPVPGLPAPRLGVQNTATPVIINTALQLVRQEQW